MKEKLLEIINRIRTNKQESVLDNIAETDLLRDDLGFNSFDLAELTVHIEDEYDIDVFESGIVNTIGDVLKKLNK
jgi:acyl carrier protein